MKRMSVNDKSYEILKLLGHGKGAILIWLQMEKCSMF